MMLHSELGIKRLTSLYIRPIISKHGGTLATLIVVIIFFSITSKYYFTAYNFYNILNNTVTSYLLALGMVFVIASGGIDLSVGSTLAVTGVLVALLFRTHLPLIITGLVGLSIGSMIGFLNGYMVSKIRLQPFIVTLAMLSIFRGLSIAISGGVPIPNLPTSFTRLFLGKILMIPNTYIYVMLLTIISSLVMNHSRFGVHIKSIGGNEICARLCGINVTKIIIAVYMIQGLFASIASFIYMSNMDAAEPYAGLATEWLEAIAAPIIGGNKLGGRGTATIFGTLIGALILSTLRSGLNIIGMQPFFQQLSIGCVVIIAVASNAVRK